MLVVFLGGYVIVGICIAIVTALSSANISTKYDDYVNDAEQEKAIKEINSKTK